MEGEEWGARERWRGRRRRLEGRVGLEEGWTAREGGERGWRKGEKGGWGMKKG